MTLEHGDPAAVGQGPSSHRSRVSSSDSPALRDQPVEQALQLAGPDSHRVWVSRPSASTSP
jgi:hypothetical protein